MGDERLEQPTQKAEIIKAAARLRTQYRELHEDDQALLNPFAFIEQIKRNFLENENNQHIQYNDILSAIQYASDLMAEISHCRQNQRAFRFTNTHLHRGRRWIDRLDRFRVEERSAGNKLIANGAARWIIFALAFVGLFTVSMFLPIVGGALLAGLVSVMVFEFAFKKHGLKGPLYLATSAAEKYKQGSLLKKHRVGVSLGLAKLFPRLDHFANRDRPRAMHPFMGYLNQKIRPSIAQVEETYMCKIEKAKKNRDDYDQFSEQLIDEVGEARNLDYAGTVSYIERHAMQEPTIHALFHAQNSGFEYYKARIDYLENSLIYARKLLQKEADEEALKYDASLSPQEKEIFTNRIQANHAVLNKAFIARPNKNKFLEAFSFFADPVNRSVYPEKYVLPDVSDHRKCARPYPFERDRRYHNAYANKVKKS